MISAEMMMLRTFCLSPSASAHCEAREAFGGVSAIVGCAMGAAGAGSGVGATGGGAIASAL